MAVSRRILLARAHYTTRSLRQVLILQERCTTTLHPSNPERLTVTTPGSLAAGSRINDDRVCGEWDYSTSIAGIAVSSPHSRTRGGTTPASRQARLKRNFHQQATPSNESWMAGVDAVHCLSQACSGCRRQREPASNLATSAQNPRVIPSPPIRTEPCSRSLRCYPWTDHRQSRALRITSLSIMPRVTSRPGLKSCLHLSQGGSVIHEHRQPSPTSRVQRGLPYHFEPGRRRMKVSCSCRLTLQNHQSDLPPNTNGEFRLESPSKAP